MYAVCHAGTVPDVSGSGAAIPGERGGLRCEGSAIGKYRHASVPPRSRKIIPHLPADNIGGDGRGVTGAVESVFQEIDLPALRPLPREPFVNPCYIERRVPNNYHVEYAGFYYSVPHQYYKQQVTIKATHSVIEVYAGRLNRVAIHERRYTGGRYVTERSHMPSNHQAQQDANRFDGRRFRSWASSIGANTFFVIDTLLKEREVEQAAYRACMGILQFSRKDGNVRLEAACLKARQLGNISYGVIRNILKNHQEGTPLLYEFTQAVTPSHDNLRGQKAFA
jgi:hypothetical protein